MHYVQVNLGAPERCRCCEPDLPVPGTQGLFSRTAR